MFKDRFKATFTSLWSIGCLTLCLGCGDSDAPRRYKLTGMVTFGGQPIPVGEIRFSPDSQKGNEGPATLAKIEKGRFSTPPERGTLGGPMIVKIVGFDGIPFKDGDEMNESGLPLFKPYYVEVELPRESAEQDFDVPKPKRK